MKKNKNLLYQIILKILYIQIFELLNSRCNIRIQNQTNLISDKCNSFDGKIFQLFATWNLLKQVSCNGSLITHSITHQFQ